jgi:hypothetical protein
LQEAAGLAINPIDDFTSCAAEVINVIKGTQQLMNIRHPIQEIASSAILGRVSTRRLGS